MKYEPLHLTVSSSPHAHSSNSTRVIMRDVCIALIPALIGAIVFFGFRTLAMTLVSCGACVFFEWLYRNIMKKDNTVRDLSAVVTGILIAFVCPANLPYWALIIGDFFAIVLVKQLFGGIGMNIVNPALAARAFMMFAWPSLMSGSAFSVTTGGLLDGVTSATPMQALHTGALPAQSLLENLIGKVGGCMGETSAILLLLGGVYLVIRKVISPRIPVAYLLTVAALAFLFPMGGCNRVDWMLYQLLSGGLILGAVFMATDYTTSPVTHAGQICFGIGCGVLTILIRYFGSYVEGVSFAILLMNCCCGFFDKIGVLKRFGATKKRKGGAAS